MEANEKASLKPSGNRIVDALVAWSAEDAKMREKFGPDVINKSHYGKVRYDYYVNVIAKFGNTKDPEEKRWISMMKGEMKEIIKIAIPNKYMRVGHNAYQSMKGLVKFMADGVKALYAVSKEIGKAITEYQVRRKDEAAKILMAKDLQRSKTIAMYDEAVRPVLNKNNKQFIGPDRHLRGNNTETERGNDQKVRYDFNDDLPLLPKKKSKSQPVSVKDDSLITKKRESTGKGMTI